jgi:hypothetical protein
VLLFALVTGWALTDVDSEGAFHFAQAAVVLWSGLAVHWLIKISNWVVVVIAYCLNAAQFIFFMLYSYKFKEEVWLHNIRDIICLSIIVALLVAAGLVLARVSRDKKLALISD